MDVASYSELENKLTAPNTRTLRSRMVLHFNVACGYEVIVNFFFMLPVSE